MGDEAGLLEERAHSVTHNAAHASKVGEGQRGDLVARLWVGRQQRAEGLPGVGVGVGGNEGDNRVVKDGLYTPRRRLTPVAQEFARDEQRELREQDERSEQHEYEGNVHGARPFLALPRRHALTNEGHRKANDSRTKSSERISACARRG